MTANAEKTTPPSTKDDLDKLTKQLDKLELEQKIANIDLAMLVAAATTAKQVAEANQQAATSQAALLQSRLPAVTAPTKVLEGTVTTNDKFGYLANVTAQLSLEHTVTTLCQRITQNLPSTSTPTPSLLLVDSLDILSASTVRHSILTQINHFSTQIEAQQKFNAQLVVPTPEPLEVQSKDGSGLESNPSVASVVSSILPTVPVVISTALQSAANIAAYFTANYDVKGRDIDVAHDVAVSLFAGQLHNAYQVELQLFKVMEKIDTSPVLIAFTKALALRTQLLTSIASIDPKHALSATATAASGKLVEIFDAFMLTAVKPGEGSLPSLLSQALISERIDTSTATHLLWVKTSSGGGEAIIKRTLFQAGQTAYLGGMVVTYVLATKAGDIVSSGSRVALGQMQWQLAANRPPSFVSVQSDQLRPPSTWLNRFITWLVEDIWR